MAVTANQLIFDIKNTFYGLLQSTDQKLFPSDRQLFFNINTKRSLIVREFIKSDYMIPDSYFQVLKCVPLICVPLEDCPCEDNPYFFTGNVIKRTKDKIPNTVPVKSQTMPYLGIQNITMSDNITPIAFYNSHVSRYKKYAKYTGNNPYAYYLNNYIYFNNIDGVDDVNIKAIFENPNDVNIYCEKDCWNFDSPYPIPMDMVKVLKDMVLEELVKYFTNYDASNDAFSGKAKVEKV